MSCMSGVCTPTAKSAVLNVTDLQNMLASGSVKVTTSALTNDIKVQAALTWASANALTLDARRSIIVDQSVSVAGTGGLTLTTNDGSTTGDLTFGPSGNVSFLGTSNPLTINGNAYTLENSISALAAAIAASPGGRYALANSYDASKDGTYSKSPIGTPVKGTIEGLGNTISNLGVSSKYNSVALIASLAIPGLLRDLTVADADIRVNGKFSGQGQVAAVVASNSGIILNSHSSGSVTCSNLADAGGLAGYSPGTILNSHSSVAVNASSCPEAGGLVGFAHSIKSSYATGPVSASAVAGGIAGSFTFGEISQSYATGAVTGGSVSGDQGVTVGGLIGNMQGGKLSNSYATGSVAGGSGAYVGGLLGNLIPAVGSVTVISSYATGPVTTGAGGYVGGLIGFDSSNAGSISDCYWDITTSGITNLAQGAGNVGNDPGITGLTTTQLQSGLPVGFSSSVWGEKSTINDGLPYLWKFPPAS